MLTLIAVTSITDCRGVLSIKPAMDILVGCENWSLDLGDIDKMLRVVLNVSDLVKLITFLERQEFQYHVLVIFDTDLGVDHPLLLKDFK